MKALIKIPVKRIETLVTVEVCKYPLSVIMFTIKLGTDCVKHKITAVRPEASIFLKLVSVSILLYSFAKLIINKRIIQYEDIRSILSEISASEEIEVNVHIILRI